MEMIGIALIVFSNVLLITSVYYIAKTTRHKEKMLLIEKGMDPQQSSGHNIYQQALRAGFAMIGAGVGFFCGVLLETSQLFPAAIELPLYFAPILFCSGIALVVFYKKFRNSANN